MKTIIKLPPVDKYRDFPLIKALQDRRSKRRWKDEDISMQDISNLLWCACGITKKKTKRAKSKRTIPSATNCQCIQLYIALGSGVYLYDDENHSLIEVLSRDIRDKIGNQKMMKSAPMGIIYVSNYTRMLSYLAKDEGRRWFVSGTECGYISQNIYLYCASAKLSTVMIGLVNRQKLEETLALNNYEKVVYTQVVGKSIE